MAGLTTAKARGWPVSWSVWPCAVRDPEKNKVNWLKTKGADPATVSAFRKLPVWVAQADQLKKARITAIDLWRAELLRSASGAAPSSPFDDDAIPY
jgi:hypothetical protein